MGDIGGSDRIIADEQYTKYKDVLLHLFLHEDATIRNNASSVCHNLRPEDWRYRV
jgi:hypothetical protein